MVIISLAVHGYKLIALTFDAAMVHVQLVDGVHYCTQSQEYVRSMIPRASTCCTFVKLISTDYI